MESPYIIHAVLVAIPGKREELKKALINLVAPTQQESGCIYYMLHEDPDDLSRFMFYASFVSKEAYKEHCQTKHVKAVEIKLADALQDLDISTWRESVPALKKVSEERDVLFCS